MQCFITYCVDAVDAFFSVELRGEADEFRSRAIDYHVIFWVRGGEMAAHLDFEPLQVGAGHIFFLSPRQHIAYAAPFPADSGVISFRENFY